MLVTVRLLGPLHEANKEQEICIQLPSVSNVLNLCEVLVEKYPTLHRYFNLRDQSSQFISVAVNCKLVDFDYQLSEGDTISFFSAINGG